MPAGQPQDHPVSGRAVETLIDELYSTPNDVAAQVRRIIGAQ
jgi:hypothetical protein